MVFRTTPKSSNQKNGPRSPAHRAAALNVDEHPWHDVQNLYYELLDAFFGDEDHEKSEVIANRLERFLARIDRTEKSILGQECRSLIADVRQDYPTAIRHRLKEISHIKRLWRTAKRSPKKVKGYVLDHYRPSDLIDRYDLLAILHHDAGQLKKAIRTLWKSRELCEEHGVKFDSPDLLRDYLKEYRKKPAKKRV